MSPLTQGLNYRSACDKVESFHSLLTATIKKVTRFQNRSSFGTPCIFCVFIFFISRIYFVSHKPVIDYSQKRNDKICNNAHLLFLCI